jgi:3-oxoacyl-[acyl-carrier protein] reductase
MGVYDLTGRAAVVTGAARGIGEATVRTLADCGAAVGVVDVNLDGAAAVAESITGGGRAQAFEADVSDPACVKALVKEVTAAVGPCGILVNNAGITRDGLLVRMSEDQWNAVINVNLTGTFLMTKFFARDMLKARAGAIVNVASIVGRVGNAGQANYSASKAGVIALTKTSAREFAGRGVRVNAVAPGFIQSDMTDKLPDEIKQQALANIPLGSFGEPRDVADVVAFLVSDAARYITGQVMNIDGGMAM